MIEITQHQLRVCIEALKLAEANEKNDSRIGSVLDDLLLKTGELVDYQVKVFCISRTTRHRNLCPQKLEFI